jgi:bone morphogenetic protein receptor type-2
LLKCYGGGEHCQTPGAPTDYILIFSLEQECLQEYLRRHTIDLATLCKMSLGVARGLAHLHSDLGKPCIAHRDINSKNVLVKSDLSCSVCDLGLAVVPRRTENHSLSEAG